MNRIDFGKIVASLRQDLGLTQTELAERADVAFPIVSQIERGVKRNFNAELLVALADALELSTFERRQFMLAAIGVEPHNMVRPNLTHSTSETANAKKELDKIQAVVEQLRVPAFVVDPFYDFVMVNRILLKLFGVDDSLLASLAETPLAFNSINITFGKILFTRQILNSNWEQYAFNTMRGFRELSLRYRAHPYFEYMLSVYRNSDDYPFFERFWKMVSSVEEDKEANWDFLEYEHKKFGHLKYMAESVIFITVYGELYVILYQPLTEKTQEVFSSLAAEAGAEVVRLAPWPEKKFPGAR